MDIFKILSIIIILIMAVSNIVLGFTRHKEKKQERSYKKQKKSNLVVDGVYSKKYLFTKNEYAAYFKLKEIADKNNYILFTKIRMLDLVEPDRRNKDYRIFFWKIQSKHVDFIMCDSKLVPKYIIELDDDTHSKREREERDKFVDAVFKDAGYTLIRTRYIDDEFESKIEKNK